MTDPVQAGQPSKVRLRAVVAVDPQRRVRCQQPGCGHSIYAAIHVVEEDGRLLVLGSTCFENRYGGPDALGHAQYGGGGGRKLTDEERLMLIQNTAALLAHFEVQAAAEQQQAAEKLRRLKAAFEERQAAQQPVTDAHGQSRSGSSPWEWQKPWSSVALFTAPGGTHWVRVQHRDGSQKLAPWPAFEGWDRSLPAGVGAPDPSIGAYAVNDIVETIKVLRQHGFQGPFVGRWQDVVPRRSAR